MPADSSDSPLVSPISLADLTDSVRTDEQRLQDVINEACDRIELLDLQVRAVLPEAGRRERLLAEAEQLAARYPDRDSRPPLYGVLVGVKDIIAVDGFDTRAGSALPPEAFDMPECPSTRGNVQRLDFNFTSRETSPTQRSRFSRNATREHSTLSEHATPVDTSFR